MHEEFDGALLERYQKLLLRMQELGKRKPNERKAEFVLEKYGPTVRDALRLKDNREVACELINSGRDLGFKVSWKVDNLRDIAGFTLLPFPGNYCGTSSMILTVRNGENKRMYCSYGLNSEGELMKDEHDLALCFFARLLREPAQRFQLIEELTSAIEFGASSKK